MDIEQAVLLGVNYIKGEDASNKLMHAISYAAGASMQLYSKVSFGPTN
jgi:hypothetical protein